jgi:predicted AlkP superfamily phosphohydrolase/phosphomutase
MSVPPHRFPIRRPSARALRVALVPAWLLGTAGVADAYVGPGAGFALLTSFFVLFTTLLVALASVLSWPLRAAWWRWRRGRRPLAQAKRLIVIGFDGQEPKLTDAWLEAGVLPNFARLAATGCYHRLGTTCPAISPVAWASFSTGTNPGRHNIFDFINRDPRSMGPVPSSTRIHEPRRAIGLGRLRLPLGRPRFELLRRSEPFWAALGRRGIWSTVLRVPITFPPDRFHGAELSAMAAPDLVGTQGSFLSYTTRVSGIRQSPGGTYVGLTLGDDVAETAIDGPEDAFAADRRRMSLPLRVVVQRADARVRLELPHDAVTLAVGEPSPWTTLRFRSAAGLTVSGLCRFVLTELGEHVSVYVTPISLDPERPAMPISHPPYYATYLAKKTGRFCTLGLAEDTGGLDEGVIDDRTFLALARDIDDERQRMLFAALDRHRDGLLVCVFDGTDRVQHMFWRELDAGHPWHRTAPATAGSTAGPPAAKDAGPGAIEQLYRRNDALVGRVLDRLGPDDVLMVLSDHGFSSFRRGVNLNAWLHAHGFLALAPGRDGSTEWLGDVDWSRTRAYAMGLSGIFLNLRGREARGIVEPGAEAAALKAELSTGLRGLVDPAAGVAGIRRVFDAATVYSGPYVENAPDLVIGCNEGYRVSWGCARGRVDGPVFEDNARRWSGDHGIDPELVPGVFFCNRRIEGERPALVDVAPTALRLFGLEPPAHMEGRPLFSTPPAAAAQP